MRLDAVARVLRKAAVFFSQTAATPGCLITTVPAGTSDDFLDDLRPATSRREPADGYRATPARRAQRAG